MNVCHYIVHELKEYLYQDSPTLMFPSLITDLCQLADVEMKPNDHRLQTEKLYNHLKVKGDGGALKKKRGI